MEHWDVIIIGGGAAGFFGAITCAEHGVRRVLILEKSGQILGKVKISGGGRCNVTHDCFDPKALAKHYPRGMKQLLGNFHRFGPAETVDWFRDHGVELKTERDGRMFPTTNDSQTIIDCLSRAAEDAGVIIRTKCGVKSVTRNTDSFTVSLDSGEAISASQLLIATGGTRLTAGAKIAESLGHTLSAPVPSLFTFKIEDPRIDGLQGVSVGNARVSIPSEDLEANGPVLITHWGLSGPGILKISAWGARSLAEREYQVPLVVNWIPDRKAEDEMAQIRRAEGRRTVCKSRVFPEIPKQLWQKLCSAANISIEQTWAQLPKATATALADQLHRCTFQVLGKSLNKDEFVTCGGIDLDEVSLKTMESRMCAGLHFAGEVTNVDGITGGFNFQNAWTSGHHAGVAIAKSLRTKLADKAP